MTRTDDPLRRDGPLLLGMVHLPPLPGSPGWLESRRAGPPEAGRAWVDRAVEDARTLAEAGFDGVVVENYGDAPFFAGRLPPPTVAALAVAAHVVREALPRPHLVGVNALRNDARAAVAIAAAADLDFLRVNVLTGAALTDQGVIEGEAARVLRDRATLAPGVKILADVRVKHATPLVPRPLADEARDLLLRGRADALIVSGARTGAPADVEELRAIREALPEARILVGSGATIASLPALLAHADGVIVGTALKATAGRTTSPVDPAKAASFVRAARA